MIGGAIVLVGLVVWLVLGLSSTGAGTPPPTTPVTKALTYRQQITKSLADTQSIIANFKTSSLACGTAVCIENTANVALLAEGKAANLVHQNAFPTGTVNAATTYVKVLIQLQRSYEGLAFGAKKADIGKDIRILQGYVTSATSSAHAVEALL
jgi:hypothetical protein